ncbi:hypothetical protein [Streptomyces sp. ISL-11]|uniref:hypothetical protein n=1 Tax=Streptomyces sp. ISL-11 TaxID=2819174 RepID=UPI002034C33F|nr:hypothetical protein [Streptomyces sp. ISL-11]
MTETASSPAAHSPATSLAGIAREHLPSDTAERWTGLLRPGARLSAAEGTRPVVGRLGGCRSCRATWNGPGGKGTARCRSSPP